MIISHHISLQLARELERERIASGRAWRLPQDTRPESAQEPLATVPTSPAAAGAAVAEPTGTADRRAGRPAPSEPALECESPLRITRRSPARAAQTSASACEHARAGRGASR